MASIGVISMWRNDIKCNYMFLLPLTNLACKGLIPAGLVMIDGVIEHGYWWIPLTKGQICRPLIISPVVNYNKLYYSENIVWNNIKPTNGFIIFNDISRQMPNETILQHIATDILKIMYQLYKWISCNIAPFPAEINLVISCYDWSHASLTF